MRVIKSFFTLSTIMFTIVTSIITICCTLGDQLIEPSQIFRIAGMSVALAVLTILQRVLEEKQWMLRISYEVRRLIFAPFYLGITLLTFYHFGYPINEFKKDAVIIVISFIVAFLICGCIKAIFRKKQVRVYMEDIKAYQNKIGGQACEETK